MAVIQLQTWLAKPISCKSVLSESLNIMFQSCAADKDLDRKCQSHCYRVVKPLLQHASDVYQKEQEHSNLLAKIQQQEINIKSIQADQAILQAKIDDQNHSLTICKDQLADKDALIEHKNAVIKELQIKQEVKPKTMQVDQDNLQAKVKSPKSLLESYESHLNSKDALIEHERETCSKLCDSMLARLDWTVVPRRKDGRVNFNQTWSEYRQGFGNPQGEFFLGLEKLHMLTKSQPHELFIYLQNFENQTSFARYDHFLIGDESESFNIKSLGKYSGTAGDALIYHKGMKFSTIDRKNDLSDFHCAAEWSSGWWFNKCYHW